MSNRTILEHIMDARSEIQSVKAIILKNEAFNDQNSSWDWLDSAEKELDEAVQKIEAGNPDLC